MAEVPGLDYDGIPRTLHCTPMEPLETACASPIAWLEMVPPLPDENLPWRAMRWPCP